MHRPTRTALTALAAMTGLATAVAMASSASADPVNKNTSVVPVTCADGSTYHATGIDHTPAWAVGHDVDSGATLIPTAIDYVHVELYTPDGSSLIAAFDEPGTAKGTAETSEHGSKACTVHFDGPESIPDIGDAYVEVTVHLQLLVTPAR